MLTLTTHTPDLVGFSFSGMAVCAEERDRKRQEEMKGAKWMLNDGDDSMEELGSEVEQMWTAMRTDFDNSITHNEQNTRTNSHPH